MGMEGAGIGIQGGKSDSAGSSGLRAGRKLMDLTMYMVFNKRGQLLVLVAAVTISL